MSSILYYSNYCENSKALLSKISNSSVKNNLHFICIDKRVNRNGSVYVVLENNQQIILPNSITSVPSLLLINDNYKVISGIEISDYLKPVEKVNTQQATNFNGEPSAFDFNNGLSGLGVASDNFSFLDQNSDDLSAKGDGGLRQLYNYATINHSDKIETPPDEYVPDKVNDDNLKNYESQRNDIT